MKIALLLLLFPLTIQAQTDYAWMYLGGSTSQIKVAIATCGGGLANRWNGTSNQWECVGSGGVGSGYVLVDGSLDPDMTGKLTIRMTPSAGQAWQSWVYDATGTEYGSFSLQNGQGTFYGTGGLIYGLAGECVLQRNGILCSSNSSQTHIRNTIRNIPTWLQNMPAITGGESAAANYGTVIGPSDTNDAYANDHLWTWAPIS